MANDDITINLSNTNRTWKRSSAGARASARTYMFGGKSYTEDELRKMAARFRQPAQPAPSPTPRRVTPRRVVHPTTTAGAAAGAASNTGSDHTNQGNKAVVLKDVSFTTGDTKVDQAQANQQQVVVQAQKPVNPNETLDKLGLVRTPETKTPWSIPPWVKPTETGKWNYQEEEMPGLSLLPGLLSALVPDPTAQFHRMPAMDRWDAYGRKKYEGIWKDSETDPYKGGYFRNALRTMQSGTEMLLEQDAQKQAMQAASGQGQALATTGTARGLASMAPGYYQSVAGTLSRGYDIRNQAANFRDNFNTVNVNADEARWERDWENERLAEQNVGLGNAVRRALPKFAAGMEFSAMLQDREMYRKEMAKKLGGWKYTDEVGDKMKADDAADRQELALDTWAHGPASTQALTRAAGNLARWQQHRREAGFEFHPGQSGTTVVPENETETVNGNVTYSGPWRNAFQPPAWSPNPHAPWNQPGWSTPRMPGSSLTDPGFRQDPRSWESTLVRF